MTRYVIVVSLLCVMYAACSGSDGDDEFDDDHGTIIQSSATGMDDGKFHPMASGVQISETAACDMLRDAFESSALDIPGCAKTAPVCPNLLRVQFVTPCMNYDLATIDACVEYYKSIKVCAELAIESCVVVPYPETAGAGCPEM